ncbi:MULTISPECIES: 4-hydroxy-tetrahydrodipicolinate synthase [Gammaproteobacteria]|uniref:4-hydroxy-tetrahydrodipicolinate synthase n=1 Tax=Gammaproteobacteria TaxID=1236 RepID=UPI000DD0B2BF|nr:MULTISPECIES: 4-hydroxy-tetrahydrodipicolinate synthase [Gammaproteobacteria]RTE87037.1 4-hydroxy-tetrahydrodipicolinate synthase [Aliidiomarina sp. B3213]TCZ93173.1 4-hydroxy-tetrahydrodipicolinate synthase [Lysobacter sp. N42]
MLTGSMVALVTPFTSQGNVDYSLLAKLVEFHIQEGTDAIVSVGTTGESTTLSHDEHVDVVKATVEVADKRIKVVAGNGSNSTSEAVQLTERIAPLGVDGFLNVTPYYNKPPKQGLIGHFSACAEASDVPQILYNVPGRTCCDIQPEVVAELAQIQNVVGIKEATGEVDRVAKIRDLCGPDFIQLSGDDPTAAEFLLAGGHGVISVTANITPKLMKELVDTARRGESEAAHAIDAKMRALHDALFIEANPIPVKWAMARLGWVEGNYRLPLVSPELESQKVIEEALKQAGLV